MKTHKILVNKRYVPKMLSKKDTKKQWKMLNKSRKLYKKKIYFTRKNIGSFKNKTSKHILNAQKIYKVNKIDANAELAKATGCSKTALHEIIRKGQGAYFSSGSRPNQTAQSWGKARLASSITGGKAAAVDFSILQNGCKPNSKALRLAKKSILKYGHGTRRAPKRIIVNK